METKLELNKVHNGDCIEVLKTFPDNSVDAIVTDPPYELGFMGKKWDNTGIAYNVEMWKECLRVLKPGGHLLSFGGTRTYHRMAVAIEDAGFEVRDMIEWVYGSGFPKSLNIGKAVDKLQGNEREVVGISRAGSKERNGFKGDMAIMPFETETIDLDITKGTSEWEGWGTALKPAHEPICMARKPLAEKTVAENVLKYGTGGINIDESRVETSDSLDGGGTIDKSNYSTVTLTSQPVRGRTGVETGGRFPANLIHDNSEEVRECFPEQKSGARSSQHQIGNDEGEMFNHGIYGKYKAKNYDDVPAESGNASRFFKSIPDDKKSMWFNHGECDGKGIPQGRTYNDVGNASRFFKSIIYQAKASRSERNKGCEELDDKQTWASQDKREANSFDVFESDGRPKTINKNNHPTVKPIALMEYLIKMVTPKGGIVLDPFAGSGSTLVSAKMGGFKYVGIELDKDYCNIIQNRIDNGWGDFDEYENRNFIDFKNRKNELNEDKSSQKLDLFGL